MSNNAVASITASIPGTSVTVEVTPTLTQTIAKGDTVTYHGTMKGFQGQPFTVKAMDPEGRLSLVTESGRMIASIRPTLVRLVK